MQHQMSKWHATSEQTFNTFANHLEMQVIEISHLQRLSHLKNKR